MLVMLTEPLSSATGELAGATEVLLVEGLNALLLDSIAPWLDDTDGVGTVLEVFSSADDDVAGVGVGVMKDVDSMVWASSVASGCPFGLRNVTADRTCVKTVCCMGSTTIAVSALTDFAVD
jgi:hypothetical protein